MSGKGSKPRPFSVPLDHYESEHDRIFGTAEVRSAEVHGFAEVHSDSSAEVHSQTGHGSA